MVREETRFDQALASILRLQSYKAIPELLHTINELYGTANLGYHALQIDGVAPAELPIIATCDPAWVKRYRDREFVEIDPVAKAARQTTLPIDWAIVDRGTADAKRYFFELSRFDIGRQGLGIPIHGPQGNAIFTFTSHIADDADWRTFRRRSKPELSMLAHYLHDKALSLVRGDRDKAVLSRQERNCLELSAQGHNALIIADMLGVSVHTARMHLSRAQKRLNAHSRTEAVVKALGRGLIRTKRQAVILAASTAAFGAATLFEIPALLT